MPVFFRGQQKNMRLFSFPFKKIFTHWLVLGIGLTFFSLIIYGYYCEPNAITVQHVEIKDSTLHNAWGSLRIVHLSDLHVVKQEAKEEKVLAIVQQLQPDIICITGDISQWGEEPDDSISFVRQLTAPLGVYCVLGDSDTSNGRRSCLFCHPANNPHQQRSTPVMLKNKIVEIDMSPVRKEESNGRQKLLVVGLHADKSGSDSIVELFENREDENLPLLLLSHFATQWKNVKSKRALLWLSGDTHGGQVLMPDLMWKWFSGKSDVTHRAGLFYTETNKWLYVNSGIGTTARFPFRFGVPPEITLLTIMPPSAAE